MSTIYHCTPLQYQLERKLLNDHSLNRNHTKDGWIYWVWKLIIFLISKVLFQLRLDPRRQWGGVVGLPPHYSCKGVQGGGNWLSIPPWWGFRGSTPERIFFLKCFVKYCNFVVNMDHSLCHRSNSRSYVNLGIFSLEENPLLYMRELYYSCVLF